MMIKNEATFESIKLGEMELEPKLDDRIHLMPFEWLEEDFPIDSYRYRFQIGIFAKNRQSETCYLRVDGYRPSAYLQLPLQSDTKEGDTKPPINYTWTKELAGQYLTSLNTLIQAGRGKKPRIQLELTDFDTYRRYMRYVKDMIMGEKPMIRIAFATMRDLRAFSEGLFTLSSYEGKKKANNIKIDLEGNPVTLCWWEDDIYTYKKLTVERQLEFANWLSGDLVEVSNDSKQSTCRHEYTCRWDTLQPTPPEVAKGWQIHPVVWSFDNEAYSDNPRIFPNAYNKKHEVFMISGCLERFEVPGSMRKICLMTTDCQYQPQDGYEKILLREETDLRKAFCDLLHEEEVDILIGHNIYKFDLPYLDVRFHNQWTQHASRLKHRLPNIRDNSWESNNGGTMKITKIGFYGRIAFDTYPIIKASIVRLNDYTLNTVCEHYLGEKKHDVHHSVLFAAFERFHKAKKNMEKCTKEVDDEGKPSRFHENITKEVLEKVITEYEAAMVEMKRITLYCIQDSTLVLKLFYKINLWHSVVADANIAQVRLVDVYDRGVQLKGVSQIYQLCKVAHRLPQVQACQDRYNKIVIFDRKYAIEKEGKYKGAICVDPIIDYHRGAITLDVNSMYPNLMISRGIDPRCYIKHKYLKHFKKEDVTEIEWDNEDGKQEIDQHDGTVREVPSSVTHHYFLKPSITLGLFPLMVANHLAARAAVRKLVKPNPDNNEEIERENMMIEIKQNKYKVYANGSYGIMGIGSKKNPRMPFIIGAECIAREGRKLLTTVRKFLEEKYKAITIYGDTDSLMFVLPGDLPPVEIIRLAKLISKEVGELIKPMVMAFEKAGDILCLAHKKYIYYMYDITEQKKGKPNPDYGKLTYFKNTGVEDTRRDNSKSLKDVSGKVRDLIFAGKSTRMDDRIILQQCIDVVLEASHKIIRNELPLENYIIFKGLKSRSLYKKGDSAPMRVFAENMKKFGKILKDGERFGYVVCKFPGENAKTKGSEKMRLLEVYKERIVYGESIDFEYYLECLSNAIDGRLIAAFQRTSFELARYNKPEIIREIVDRLKRTGLKDNITNYASIEVSLMAEIRQEFETKQYQQKLPEKFDELFLFKDSLPKKSPEKKTLGLLLGRFKRTGLPLLLPSNAIMSQIISANDLGLLAPYTQIMASPELYQRLYPK